MHRYLSTLNTGKLKVTSWWHVCLLWALSSHCFTVLIVFTGTTNCWIHLNMRRTHPFLSQVFSDLPHDIYFPQKFHRLSLIATVSKHCLHMCELHLFYSMPLQPLHTNICKVAYKIQISTTMKTEKAQKTSQKTKKVVKLLKTRKITTRETL